MPSKTSKRVASNGHPKTTGSQASGNAHSPKSVTTTISTGGSSLSNNGTSTGNGELADQDRSAPGLVWCHNRNVNSASVDQTAINAVVTGSVFPKVKIVDKESQLSYSADKKTICQFVITRCNLQPDVIEAEWWRSAQNYVNQTINRLRNDRNTAMKGAMIGKLQLGVGILLVLLLLRVVLLQFTYS